MKIGYFLIFLEILSKSYSAQKILLQLLFIMVHCIYKHVWYLVGPNTQL